MNIKTAHQKAEVQIVNKTGHDWLSVSLAHKYSNKYKNKAEWKNVPMGKSTSTAVVDFNTGIVETGLDWWLVSWVTEEGTVYMTDPHNFGEVRDFVEKLAVEEVHQLEEYAKEVLPVVGGAALGTAIEPGGGTIAGAVVGGLAEHAIKPVTDKAVNLVGKVADHVLNGESTAGFKEHLLRAKDSKRPTKIIITKQRVEFHSPSGVSRTRFRKIKSAIPVATAPAA